MSAELGGRDTIQKHPFHQLNGLITLSSLFHKVLTPLYQINPNTPSAL